MHETGTKRNNELLVRVRLELGRRLMCNDNQLKLRVHMIPQLLLESLFIQRGFSILNGPRLRFIEVESNLNSSLRPGMATGESLGYLPD